jgi:hypothetical protein
MTKWQLSKLVHEGEYVAEVEVELIYADEDWSPHLSLTDAQKLDEVRLALRRGDLEAAARLAPAYNNPNSCARSAAWVRSRAPIFCRMLVT